MNDIIGEIHRIREKQAAECSFDPRRIGERLRLRQRERAAHGVRYVSFVKRHGKKPESCVVQEDPPHP